MLSASPSSPASTTSSNTFPWAGVRCIEGRDVARCLVLNKADRVPGDVRAALEQEFPGARILSDKDRAQALQLKEPLTKAHERWAERRDQ